MSNPDSTPTQYVNDALSLRTMEQLCLLVGSAGVLLGIYLFFFTPNASDTLAAVMIAVFAGAGWGLIKRGHVRHAIHLVIVGVMAAATAAALTFGSVRAAGVLLFLGAVAGAGIFTGRRALIGTVATSIFLISVLILAEWQGWLVPRGSRTGAPALVTYVVTILVVALMVYYSRKRTEQTLLKLTAELNTRQRTEKERDRSMQRFARIFRSSPSPMLAQSARDGTILDVNPAFERCYGYTPNQVLGRTDTMLWAQPEQRIGYINTLAAHSRTELARVSALRSDGSHFDVLLSSELGNDPDDRLVITTVTDISSESRRAALLLSVAQGMTGETGEAFFAALARHAAAAFEADLVVVSELLADQRVQTLAVSKDGEPFHNFTYTPQGTPCGETLSRTDLYVHEVGLSTAFPAEQPLTGVHADAYVGQSLRDQDGTAIGVLKAMWRKPISLNAEMRALMSIFSSRATAELMRLRREREIQLLNATLEQRVKLRTAELEKLNAELDSFAYSVSHDLKSPLRSIDGFTRLLAEQLEGRLSPDEAHLFDRVLVSTRRMSTLIADLLALARVSQGQLELESTNLSELAEQVLRAEQMRQPDSPLRWHVEPGLVSRCDPKLVRIALENLLGNAVKYSRNEPSPLVEMGLTHRGGDTLFVRDNGVGFDMAHADKLFKPFQRLHMPNSGFEGTGIGLATVHRIVERHGGRITAESHPGKGAVFYFTLAANALPTMAFDLASA